MTTVSVLICTYNRHEMLRNALVALVDDTTEKPDEVVIVNGGDDRTDRIVEAFDNRHGIRLKVVKTVNKNLATSRNIGLSQCSGDIVAMTDDDGEVFPNWITQIKRIHGERADTGAVGGAVIGASSQLSFISRLSDIVTFVSPDQPCSVRNLPGVNASYKRAAVNQVGPQDETLFRGEDVDYNWRVRQAGWDVYYDPSIKVTHHHRPNLKQFIRQHYMYGRAYYLVRRKWPDMYCVYPHRFRRVRDALKAGYFLVSVVVQPVQMSLKLSRWTDRIAAIPVLVVNQIAWKTGMIYQAWISRQLKVN